MSKVFSVGEGAAIMRINEEAGLLERALIHTIRRSTDVGLRATGFRRRFVETSLGRVHALDMKGEGELPPLVLFHGLGSRATDYMRLMQGLRSQHRRLLALDMPGHGRSWTPRPYAGSRPVRQSMMEAADVLLDEPAILFGNSLGGLVAIRYALERPERALGLMLVNPGGAPLNDEELAQLLSRFKFDTRADSERFIDGLLGRSTRLKGVLAWGVRRRMSRSGTRQLIERIDHSDLLSPEELARLSAPIYFFWGRRDRILPDSNRRFFLEHLPAGTRVDQPEDYGHVPYIDDHRAFLEIVRGFARSLAD